MSTHAQETDFDDVPDLPAVGLPGAVVRSYEVQSDETGVIFRDGFEQPVIEDWGRRTRGRKSGSGTWLETRTLRWLGHPPLPHILIG